MCFLRYVLSVYIDVFDALLHEWQLFLVEPLRRINTMVRVNVWIQQIVLKHPPSDLHAGEIKKLHQKFGLKDFIVKS